MRSLDMLAEAARQDEVAFFQFALVHMGLGNHDEAFELLERSYDNREFVMAILNVGETLGALRDDPRFESLLRRIGFTVGEDGSSGD